MREQIVKRTVQMILQALAVLILLQGMGESAVAGSRIGATLDLFNGNFGVSVSTSHRRNGRYHDHGKWDRRDRWEREHRRNHRRGRRRGGGYSGGGYNSGYGNGYGVQCVVENSWGNRYSYRSCRDCLRVNGSCVETCRQEQGYVAIVEGEDYNYRRVTVRGKGLYRREARERAFRKCERKGLYHCQMLSNRYSNGTVSRRSCR